MKSHYRTEAEFLADFHAMMAARQKLGGASLAPPNAATALPIARKRIEDERTFTKPVPITRSTK